MLYKRNYDILSIHYVVCINSPTEKSSVWDTCGLQKIEPVLPFLPNNLIQVFTPCFFSSYAVVSGISDFKLSFVHSFNSFEYTIEHRKPYIITCVLFADWNRQVFDYIKDKECFFAYAVNIPDSEKNSICFSNIYDFVQILKKSTSTILARLPQEDALKIKELISEENVIPVNGEPPLYSFSPSIPISGYINSFTGTFWNKHIIQTPLDYQDRFPTLIKLLKQADGLYLQSMHEKDDTKNELSTLVILIPYFGKEYRQCFKGNVDSKYLNSEEDSNYIYALSDFSFSQNIKNPVFFHLKQNVIKELQAIAFLHSKLMHCSMIRLPEKGYSISTNIAKFYNGHAPKERKLYSELFDFGKQLGDKVIGKELNDYLVSFERQLVFISDLPMEWSTINEVPLAFLFDVCRCLVTPHSRLIHSFAYNNHSQFVIDDNILEKTLIISSSEEDIASGITDAKLKLVNASVQRLVCKNVSEVISAIQTVTPELLIFDCHGSFNSETNYSYLHFGTEKLDCETVLKEKLSAPLVILSCCNTVPVNCFNSIAASFLGTNSFAVLSTYHPIGVQTGAMFILRILGNLRKALNLKIHKNWLEFISHNLRTSLWFDYMKKINSCIGFTPKVTDFIDKQVKWASQSMNFATRMKCFLELKEQILEAYPTEEKDKARHAISVTDFPVEFLFYTHLGRPDLVKFKHQIERENAEFYGKYSSCNHTTKQ